MMGTSLGDLLDGVATVVDPNSPALIHNDRTITWGQFDKRTNNLANAILKRGVDYNDKAAVYMRNCSEYSEAVAAAFKSRTVHLNVNFRYTAEELTYIFDNSDAAVIFFSSEFAGQMTALKDKLPKVKLFIEVTPLGAQPLFDGALSHEDLVNEGDGAPLAIERSGDDLFFLYTGGTTGMPKAVMWPHETFRSLGIAGAALLGKDMSTLASTLATVKAEPSVVRMLPACPLMHGTGLFTSLSVLFAGGAVVTMDAEQGLDTADLWRTVVKHGVNTMAIVGDAFGKPLLKELEENPGKYNLDHMAAITSSGVMWSREVKLGLLKHMPNVILNDSFGASEAVGFGASVMANGMETTTAKFAIGDNCKVFTEDDREVMPGSGEPGYIARGGHIPLGYFKDEEKSAKTFKTINGERYSIPGDWCTVEADGTLTLLGRGSVCINSAGEKIYPEEVEEVIKSIDGIRDALVVGVPDDKWGNAVIAVIEGDEKPADELKRLIKLHLASYKVPKKFLFKDTLGRAPNGKADYKTITAYAKKILGIAG
jgi:acyl-CoA synthetase (AMP-forming)/AMP-acid ligase II